MPQTGAVSFGQIVKAAEPVHAAMTGAALLGEIDHPMVYLTLLPIIGGVGLASLKELDFKLKALLAALCANQVRERRGESRLFVGWRLG